MNKGSVVVRQRSNSLGLAFQDVVTATLRVRYRTQHVSNAAAFRDSIRKMIAAGVQDGLRIGYGRQTSQMALYAIVVFLDESVLSLNDDAFQEWAQHPLQDEMFPGQAADQHFFRHINELFNQPESFEVADALELHAVCLLLGYRGKYAPDDDSEIQAILRRIRERIARIRGPVRLCRFADPLIPKAEVAATRDPWVKRLIFLAGLVVLAVVAAFAGYCFLLNHNLNAIQTNVPQAAALIHKTSSPASFDEVFAI